MVCQITIEKYSDEYFIIRESIEKYNKELTDMNGYWAPYLKGGAGYIFSKDTRKGQ